MTYQTMTLFRRFTLLPVHPVLFSWWFLLLVFTNNIAQLALNALVTPMIMVTAIVGLLLSVAYWLTRDTLKAAILATLGVLAFFSFGYLRNTLASITGRATDKIITLVVLLVFVMSSLLVIRSRGDSSKATAALNLVAAVLVAVNLAIILGDWVTQTSLHSTPADAAIAITNSSTKPDVYYFVPDRYASNNVWKEYFAYDNMDFLQALRARGFKIYDDAHSNYQVTVHSLSSTLNMRYLDREANLYNGKTKSLIPLHELIENNRVVNTFKLAGYHYVHIGSWWTPTADNRLADESLGRGATYTVLDQTFNVSEYAQVVIKRTMAEVVIRRGIDLKFKGHSVLFIDLVTEHVHARSFHNQLEAIMKAADIPGPKFVFVHILMPHPPFVFDAEGNLSTDSIGTNAQRYINQLKYTNQQLLRTIDGIRTRSNTDPAIVIQADEGPFPGEGTKKRTSTAGNWHERVADDLRIKFGIVRAVHLPDVAETNLPKELASVNLFRYIFNEYLGSNLKLLSDKAYVFPSYDDPYNFAERTRQVEY